MKKNLKIMDKMKSISCKYVTYFLKKYCTVSKMCETPTFSMLKNASTMVEFRFRNKMRIYAYKNPYTMIYVENLSTSTWISYPIQGNTYLNSFLFKNLSYEDNHKFLVCLLKLKNIKRVKKKNIFPWKGPADIAELFDSKFIYHNTNQTKGSFGWTVKNTTYKDILDNYEL